MENTETLVIQTLDKIRPFIQRDGGDIEFVKLEDGIVYLRVHGACIGCSLIDATIKDTVEVILQEEVEGIKEVKVLEDNF